MVLDDYLDSYDISIEQAWLNHIAHEVMDYQQGAAYEKYLGYYSVILKVESMAKCVTSDGSGGWQSCPTGTPKRFSHGDCIQLDYSTIEFSVGEKPGFPNSPATYGGAGSR